MTRDPETQNDSAEALARLQSRARLGWWLIAAMLALAFGFVIVSPGLSLFPALIGAFAARWTLKRSQAADEMGERLRTRVCFACGYDCSELEIREHPMCPECGAVRGSTIRTARPT